MIRDSEPAAVPGRADRRVAAAVVVVLVVFTTGVRVRPDGVVWALAYDLVLYNAVYVLAALWAWRSGRRGSAGRWLAVGLVLNAAGNALYTVQDAASAQPATPSAADVLCLAFYPFLYVAVVTVVRSRAPHFHARMWLDGVIGACGAAAVAVAVLLAPALDGLGGALPEYLTNLAFPVADVLLLALVVGVGGALGLRSDRAVLTVCAGLALHLLGDVVYLNLQAVDRYVEGGVLDLTWLVGVACVAAGVQPSGLPTPAARSATSRNPVEWRVLAVPVACSVASVVLLAAGWGDRLPVSVACCAVACLAAVVARTVLTFRELRRLRDVGHEARTDDLTGLPNRRALVERVEAALATAGPGRPAALLLLDLDGFKQVNDRHGHGAGDELLRQVGARLQGTVRPSDTVARLGGDEFAVVLPDTAVDAAQRLAVRLREVLDQPFVLGDASLRVGGSIGVAAGDGAPGTVDDLLQRADHAMYVAKDAPDGVRVHVDEGARAGSAGRDAQRDGADLRAALASGQVTVHLAPQTSLVDGRTVAVRAVLRWRHPRRGVLESHELRALATRAGLGDLLTEAVVELASAAAARWWSNRPPLPVAVGLSAPEQVHPGLPGVLAAALARHGLPPRALRLQVPEESLTDEATAAVLARLRRGGVAVGIDGYGTGPSPLAALRRAPADELTLAADLVADVATDPAAAAVAWHTVALAHALGMRVVADGVGDVAVLGALAAMGCDAAQGDDVGPAMPVDPFLAWLRGRPADRLVPVTSVRHEPTALGAPVAGALR